MHRIDGTIGDRHPARRVPADRPAKSSIILIEGGKRILSTFAEKLAKKAARRLEKLNVKIITGARVEKVDENGVVADGRRFHVRRCCGPPASRRRQL